MSYQEAFCLMIYRSDDGTIEETIWNSRDGVTPFIVRAKDGKTELTHADWHLDKCDPYHMPKVGDRVFVDMAREVYLDVQKAFVEKWWDGGVGTGPMKDNPVMGPLGKEGAAKRLTESGWTEGTPGLIIATEGFCRELKKKRAG